MIELERNSIKKSKSGRITGKIHIKLPERSFPEVGWNDFPVTILNWWCECFLNGKVGDYFFMDGPFYFKIFKKDNHYFVEAFRDRKFWFSNILDINAFEYSLINVVEILIKTIGANGLDIDKEVQTLNESLYKLKKNRK